MTIRDSVGAPGSRRNRRRRLLQTVAIGVIGMAMVGLFIYFDRRDELSLSLRNLGVWGVVASILLMAILCVVPVPSEFLLLMDMRVYGVWWGACYAWIGSILGAVLILIVARSVGRPLLESFVAPERYERVNSWVKDKGWPGLLMARLLPLPASVINYLAGLVRSVSPWHYTWTAAVSIIPYYVGAALLYMGIFTKFAVWLFVGAFVVIGFWITSYLVNRRLQG